MFGVPEKSKGKGTVDLFGEENLVPVGVIKTRDPPSTSVATSSDPLSSLFGELDVGSEEVGGKKGVDKKGRRREPRI